MSPFFAAFFLLGLCVANAINFTTVYEWDQFDFIWPSGSNSSIEEIKQNIEPKNVAPNNMAVFGERLFLSFYYLSRTLASVVWLPTSAASTAPPKLAPFPSWDFHKKDNNCNTIEWARGMEADTDGRLWVLDQGSKFCPSKLWIFNLLNNDTTERVHKFPDNVISHSINDRWLLDIVIDKTPDDDLAYIVDTESIHAMVVYSRKMDKSWTVKTPGRKWSSLAISPNRAARQLYLRRYSSKELYSLSVSELKNEGGSAAVKLIGEFTHRPYRMLIDSANVLYAAFFYQSYVSKWNISEPFHEQRFYEVGELGASFPFTFALDTTNTFWMTERNQSVDETKPRHKLLKAVVGAGSY
ncbi:protein yellow-like [Cloeon dipterum]|uniref:protein yellow-like n=1 Tax=Cloeon dipterum TaxID=197152 RepID=UPI0032200557